MEKAVIAALVPVAAATVLVVAKQRHVNNAQVVVAVARLLVSATAIKVAVLNNLVP